MYSKSSTSLAFISILSIIIVFFLAIDNLNNKPIRKPFPTSGFDIGVEESEETQKEDSSGQETDNNVIGFEFSGNQKIEIKEAKNNIKLVKLEHQELPANTIINKNINSELLYKVGFRDFIIKPIPFNNKLFNYFRLDSLEYLNIQEKEVHIISNLKKEFILNFYEFNTDESSQITEVYDFLKANIKDNLNVSVNETNQFGIASFFINFSEGSDYAFLVVKTRSNVYALSYPKDNSDGISYYELITKLFLDLI